MEDHPDTIRILAVALRRLGHEVATATTVAEAVGLLSNARYDVLLSDIGLPDGNGWSLLSMVPRPWPRVSIAMSGYGSENDLKNSRAAGFSWHLVKPFKMDKLKAVLEKVIEGMG